jgi:hypothetical protein
MSAYIPMGGLTNVVMGQSGLLENAFGHFLSLELNGDQLNAQRMQSFATEVTSAIATHLEPLAAALPPLERINIEKIATESRIPVRTAQIEYLSNAYLVRAIRDYFDLPAGSVFPQFDTGGFLAFTGNGSIIASPPEPSPRRGRTLHYSRMPSRDNSVQTRSYPALLLGDITVGDSLASSAFRTSAVRMLLTIPPRQALLFDEIQQTTLTGSASVSMILSRRV